MQQLSCKLKLKASQQMEEMLTIDLTVNGGKLGEKSFRGDDGSNDTIVKHWLACCMDALPLEGSQNTTATNMLYQCVSGTVNSPEWGTIERYRGIERQVDIQLN